MIVNKVSIQCECPFCHAKNEVHVDPIAYQKWKGGELIQRAMPELNADQRELLMTGICPTCWDNTFGGDE